MRWGGRLGGRRDQERQEDQQQRVSWILRMLTSSGGASAEVTINNHTLTGEPSTTVPMWKEEGDVVDVPTGQDRQAPAEDGGGGKMASGVVWSRLYIRVHGGSRDSTWPLGPIPGAPPPPGAHVVLSPPLSGSPSRGCQRTLPLDLLCLFPGPLRPPILLFPPLFS